jgi:hypothetical protein
LNINDIPEIRFDSIASIKEALEFVPYQPFFIRNDETECLIYYAFLAIRGVDDLPLAVSSEGIKVSRSLVIEVLFLGAITYKFTPVYGEIQAVSERVTKALVLSRLKREVESGQSSGGLRLNAIDTVTFVVDQDDRNDNDMDDNDFFLC